MSPTFSQSSISQGLRNIWVLVQTGDPLDASIVTCWSVKLKYLFGPPSWTPCKAIANCKSSIELVEVVSSSVLVDEVILTLSTT